VVATHLLNHGRYWSPTFQSETEVWLLFGCCEAESMALRPPCAATTRMRVIAAPSGASAMRAVVGLALAAATAAAAESPEWAYPPLLPLETPDATRFLDVPGSEMRLTQMQIDDDFHAPDWHPREHPPMPSVVEFGRRPLVRACARCHLPDGSGHPESAGLAGLPVVYMLRQMAEMKEGLRAGGRSASMLPIARAATDAEDRAAAAYFAALKPRGARVVEAAVVPRSYVGQGAMRFAEAAGETEPIGQRIIELPEHEDLAKRRDSHNRFVAYVPPGSLAAGELLATTGGAGRTVACASCHGPGLRGGISDIPGIAGLAPIYLYRQLSDFKTGSRHGAFSPLMAPTVAKLTPDDMLAISAYVASCAP